MPRIKQVLRCYAAGKGTKSISSLMDISRTTVKKYINTFNQCGKSIEEVMAMEEDELLRLFNEKPDPRPLLPKSERYVELMERMPEYARMLRKKGMTKYKVYQRYLDEFPNGYKHSQFYRALQTYLIQSAPIAHLEHKAGDRMYVDFAGDHLHIIDRETGERVPVEVFVAILPCSQLTYVEIQLTIEENFVRIRREVQEIVDRLHPIVRTPEPASKKKRPS